MSSFSQAWLTTAGDVEKAMLMQQEVGSRGSRCSLQFPRVVIARSGGLRGPSIDVEKVDVVRMT